MRIKEAVIVEGAYDKIKLSKIIDAVIIKVDGFDIFKNRENLQYIRDTAKKCGIVILTDSDSAGFRIRNHIKGSVTEGVVLNAYIPEIIGKEKRKRKKSCEGLLGVEGVSDEMILGALYAAGCTVNGSVHECGQQVTRQDFYADGLSGGRGARARRTLLARALGLPPRLSSSALLEAVNTFFDYNEYLKFIQKDREEKTYD